MKAFDPKVNAAITGVIDALTGGTDDSNGAYFWESTHHLTPSDSGYRPHSMYVTLGWGKTKDTESGTIAFKELARYSTTVFMEYNSKVREGGIWP